MQNFNQGVVVNTAIPDLIKVAEDLCTYMHSMKKLSKPEHYQYWWMLDPSDIPYIPS